MSKKKSRRKTSRKEKPKKRIKSGIYSAVVVIVTTTVTKDQLLAVAMGEETAREKPTTPKYLAVETPLVPGDRATVVTKKHMAPVDMDTRAKPHILTLEAETIN
jgi:hypothetical protein